MDTPRGRTGVVLALGTFAVGTDASVIAGLLPSIAADLRVDVGTAGQLLTVFGLAYAVLAPVLAVLTGAWDLRAKLITALGLVLLGGVLAASAPSYGWVLVARVITAAGAALYTPSAIAAAAAYAVPDRQSRETATVMSGLTLASALGVPVGTVLGAAGTWRWAMWFVVVFAVLAAFAVTQLDDPPAQTGSYRLGERLGPLKDRRILSVLAVTMILFTGSYAFSSYSSVVFGEATGHSGYLLAVLLFVSGAAGTVGNLVAGSMTDRFGARPVVTVAAVVLAVDFALMPLSARTFGGALAAMAVYGLVVWSITVPQQRRLVAHAASAPALARALNSSAGYAAASVGAAAGGTLVHLAGAMSVTVFAAVLALLGLAMSEVAQRSVPREVPVT